MMRRRRIGVEISVELCPLKAVDVVVDVAKIGEVVGDGVGWCAAEHGVHHTALEPASHEPELVHPLLLAALVLEPDLDDPHGEPGVLGQLLSHHPGRLGRGVEHVLQDLQLLRGDVGPGAPSLPVLALLLVVVVLLVRVVILVGLLGGVWEHILLLVLVEILERG